MNGGVLNITLNLSKGELQLVKEAVAFYTTIMELHSLRGDIPVGFEETVKPLRRLEKRLTDVK